MCLHGAYMGHAGRPGTHMPPVGGSLSSEEGLLIFDGLSSRIIRALGEGGLEGPPLLLADGAFAGALARPPTLGMAWLLACPAPLRDGGRWRSPAHWPPARRRAMASARPSAASLDFL